MMGFTMSLLNVVGRSPRSARHAPFGRGEAGEREHERLVFRGKGEGASRLHLWEGGGGSGVENPHALVFGAKGRACRTAFVRGGGVSGEGNQPPHVLVWDEDEGT